MKPRHVLLLGLGLAVLGLGLAGAQTNAAAAPSASRASAQTSAFSADRLSFELPGFGGVGYYQDTRASGRPLLLLHSVNAAASAYEMRPIFLAYRGSRPVYALEWPGFGSSARPDVRYTPELMTRALQQMLDVIGQDVDVVALSLGSEFAARAALADPRIHTLALISPTGMGRAEGGSQQAAGSAQPDRLYRNLSNPLWAGALYSLIASGPSIRYFLSGSFEGQPDQGLVDYSYVSAHQPGARYAPLYFIGGLLFTPNAYDQLYAPLKQPVLVLYDRDRFVNFDRLQEYAQHPNVSAVRIAPTKGLPQFEQPEQVRAALDAFWSAHP
ncbi:alpha/beta hydrolase [Deinococcus sonorensis]|uniref:Alpha/beta hydrolase n=2 Tax=Deinococcus sonorensis TaxID=309891 RepID=A0AAU7UAC0_9DEIO